MRWRTILFILLLICPSVFSATYYVDNNAANDNGNGTIGSPKLYIKSGIALMSTGDTLVIKDGTYSGLSNMMAGPGEWNGIPDGSAGAYTTIRAEHDFGVILDGGGSYNPVYTTGNSYVILQGLIIKNGAFYLYGPNDHIKVLKCAAYDSALGNNCNFNSSDGDYILFEECFAWGQGRYKFLIGGGSMYTILRRCFGRYDYHDAEGPHAVFSFYGSAGGTNLTQNCLSVDNLATGGFNTTAFYAPNGSTNVTFDSCLALNNAGNCSFYESSGENPVIKNCAFWDATGVGSQMYSEPVNAIISSCTIGNVDNMGVSAANCMIKNTIIYGAGAVAINWSTNDYCDINSNQSTYSNTSGGAHNITISPLTNGLLYLPRIEAASTLKTAGESGTQIGAEIVKKLGVSGTLYGETGWNTLTNDNLWPFPNEDTIRSSMRVYTANSVDGTRGFCATDQTLTKYIWEYLGNTIPADIYNIDTTSPVISGISTTVYTTSATITWTTDEDATSRVDYGANTNYGSNVSDATPVTSHSLDITGLSAASTYHYKLTSADAAGNTSYSDDYNFATNAQPQGPGTISISGISISGVEIK